MKSILRVILVLFTFILLAGCNMRVNRSIYIADGRKIHSDQVSVNGNITVGSDCEVSGSLKTVNGTIQIGKDSKVKTLQSVNGMIGLDENVKVLGNIQAVNGGVECDPGVQVRGGVTTINGQIDLRDTKVREGLTTYYGNIRLTDHSEVDGDILIKESKGKQARTRHMQIEIAEGSVVKGDIRVLAHHTEVSVYLASGGKVEGEVIGATIEEE